VLITATTKAAAGYIYTTTYRAPFCLSHQFSHSHHVIGLLFSIYHNHQPCKPSLLGSYQLESVCIAKTCRTIRWFQFL